MIYLNKAFEELVQLIREGKLIVENISCEPHLQQRYLIDDLEEPMKVKVKTRYSSKEAKAKIIQEKELIKVIFDEPQRALTPGQSAVFYIGDIVVGGGKIM